MTPTALPSTSPSWCPSPERGNTSAHQSGSPMRKATPAETSTAGACGSRTSGSSMQACKSSPAERLDPHDGNPQPESRGSRICNSIFTGASPRPQVLSDALGEAGGNFVLGHDRPVLNAFAVYQVDRVLVAAEGAGPGRDVVGENPIAALADALGPRVCDDVVGLGGKADDQRRPVVGALCDMRKDIRVFGEAQ